MDDFSKANTDFVTAWDINVRRIVKVDAKMKKKSRKIARKNLKNRLTEEIECAIISYNDERSEEDEDLDGYGWYNCQYL